MDWSIILGLIFSGICTIEAIINIILVVNVNKKKKDINKIKEEIETYRNTILQKNDLIMLLPKIDVIKKLQKTFAEISTKIIPQPGDSKNEIQYYGLLKNEIINVMNDIPSEYKRIRKLIKEIKEALGYCITNNKKFSEFESDDEYSYSYVEVRFDSLISELNKLTREIRFNN